MLVRLSIDLSAQITRKKRKSHGRTSSNVMLPFAMAHWSSSDDDAIRLGLVVPVL